MAEKIRKGVELQPFTWTKTLYLTFGEGNFLRAFVDWQIDLLNEHTDLNSGVVVVRPIETSFPPSLSTQDGLYTTIIRGLNEKGEAVSDARLIRSVNREISVYSEYDEFLKLAHNPEMRFVFSNTTEAGISYHAGDKFDDAPAGPKSLATELRLDKYPLNVLIVDDIKPYKERKVAILNGAHTALVPVAFQAGLDTVGEAMNDAEICAFVEKAIYEEIIPVLDLPRDELESFATAVYRAQRYDQVPHPHPATAAGRAEGKRHTSGAPTFALAALIAFYRGERNGETYPVQDDAHWLERYQQLWSQHRDRVIGTQELVAIVLAEKDHWEQDLTQVPGLVEQVANDLDAILEKGMREAVRPLC
uniref:Tagaturonate reductase n=1 Tax=Panagrolaimus superbus TaxID=310955 RepID=A0A914YEN5_9BILA